MDSIWSFVKKEFILMMILFIMFLNPYFYGYRIAILLFFFIFFKLKIFIPLFDKNTAWLFVFSFSYEIFAALQPDAVDKTLISILPNIFIPSLLYLTGKYITSKYASIKIFTFLLFFISFSFSIIPLISILLQIKENGFFEGTRSMHLIWDTNYDLGATGLGSYFVLNVASISLVNIKKKLDSERWITFFVVFIFILSIVCVVRLGDRTEIAIAFLSLLFSYLINFSKQPLIKNLILLCLFVIAGFYISQEILNNSKFITFYADRLNSREMGVGTFGGRLERWRLALESLTTDPFGWNLSRFGYAHNLWLDVGREGGIISLIFLLVFTISSIKLFFNCFKRLQNNLFLRTYIFSLFVGIILIFNLEPVMDGLYLLFLLFCLLVGYISGIVYKKSYKN